MRILQVCNKSPYPPMDGGSLAIYNLAVSLFSLGHTIDLIEMRASRHPVDENYDIVNSPYTKIESVFVDSSISWSGLFMNLLLSSKPYTASRFIVQEFKAALKNILASCQYDIIQLEGLYLTPYIPLIRKYSDAKISLRAHNIEHEIWKRMTDQESSIPKKLYLVNLVKRIRNMEYLTINQYDLLVPITEKDFEAFRKMGNSKPAMVCQVGVDTDKQEDVFMNEALSDPQCPDLFFLGSLDWMPNQEGLLWFIREVLPALCKIKPECQFHIAGKNAPKYFIKKLQHKGLVFHGQIPDSTDFFRQHRILVCPCFSGSGMRVKIIEAMANGKIVITTSTGAEGISATHEQNILIADTADDFLKQIDRLWNSPELCRKLEKEAYFFAKKYFNNRKIAENLVHFYHKHLQ